MYFFECELLEMFHYIRMENPGLSHNGLLTALGLFSKKRQRVCVEYLICSMFKHTMVLHYDDDYDECHFVYIT